MFTRNVLVRQYTLTKVRYLVFFKYHPPLFPNFHVLNLTLDKIWFWHNNAKGKNHKTHLAYFIILLISTIIYKLVL